MTIKELTEEVERLKAERDAAIADIKRAWLCATCKKREEGNEWLHCEHKRFVEQPDKTLTCDNFEWRGVMNNGSEQQTEGRTV